MRGYPPGFFDTLIQRCQQRNAKRLSALKSRYPQNPSAQNARGFSVYYASQNGKIKVASPADFEKTGLGIIPTKADGFPIEKYGAAAGKDWQTRYGFSDWTLPSWRKSYGLQIYTGAPSNFITDCDLEYEFVRDHPAICAEIIRRLCELTLNPLLTISKSGGLRFTCRTPNYTHPRKTTEREYIAVYNAETGNRTELYLEIFGEKGLSRWDARYEIATGNLFKIPVIDKDTLFEIIDEYRDMLHVPPPEREAKQSSSHTQQREKRAKTKPYTEIDGLPADIQWIKTDDGYQSRRGDYPCKVTAHRKSHGSAQYYEKFTGQIEAHCHNCGQGWIVRSVTKEAQIENVRSGRLSPLAIPRKPVKLITEKQQSLLTTLAKARHIIASILRSEFKIFGMRSDTGTGKNYETETYAFENPTLVNVPTGDLAIDLESRASHRFTEKGLPAERIFRRRGLLHRWGDGKDIALRFPHEIPCIQAPRSDAYRSKGGNFRKVICPNCPVLDECKEHGYRSQEERAKDAQMVIMSDSDFHINPAKRRYAEEYLRDRFNAPRLIVTDDISMSNLFLECHLTRERLQRMRKDWNGCVLGVFAKKLLQILDVDGTPYVIGEYLQTLTEKQKSHLTYQMARVRIAQEQANGDTDYIVLRLDDAVSKGYYNTETTADIESLPTVDGEKWTILDQLMAFFTHYKREADAPISYHDGILNFVIPPRPHTQVTKALFMSATLDEVLFFCAYPYAQIENLPPTQFAAGARIYQLRTNHNPRSTLYKYENGEASQLSNTGESFWKRIIAQCQDNTETKYALITYKQVFEWKQNQIASDLSELDNIVATAHFGNLVGLDTDFENADVFHIFGSPEIPHFEIVRRAKMFFGNDDEPLDDTRDENTGEYKDQRLQRVWKNAVLGELIQAIGRARLVRKDATVILWTSHYIEGITNREETLLFDEADFDIASGLDNLDEVIRNREAFEKRAAELTAENSIAEFQEVHGCSKSKARRLWEEAGGKEQADIVKKKIVGEVLRLKAQKKPDSEIAKRLNISRGRVQYILKKHNAA